MYSDKEYTTRATTNDLNWQEKAVGCSREFLVAWRMDSGNCCRLASNS